ncbi:AprI/Inh family metalloprotease inhibitor [Devosia aurantiaca]|uniref:AprI/Inh family metalloprotease inhibitor n=1 Tax=Devosia aurantiaca TaxID=2714858 RepID=A0A6M1SP67_9HYPH|nr:AprI/Inh family metalloprotease inhibitor [Devosia aurantiaca]NGP18346.1 AprI/Inh family metalloprotease inhibitor [Devosia aurantiaca]
MQDWKRGASSIAGLAAIALLVAACSPTSRTNTANLNVVGTAPQAAAVPNSTVQTGSLPPLGGATGTPAPGLSGNPVLGGQVSSTSSLPPIGSSTQVAATTTTVGTNISGNSSITTVGAPMATGVSSGPEGAWNVVAGSATCRLNLPLTAKTGTNYYRASAPGCTVPQIASVTGWQQVGSQLQLYDDNGNIAAFLAPSSGRYIGTISGGQAVSMAR